MTVVADASMAVAWLLPDERSDICDGVLRALSAEGGLAPSIFRHEVRNILLISERRRRISPAKADELLGRLAALPVRDRGPGNDDDIIALARAHGLTAYDASYVALAISTASEIATLDKAMATAARRCGIAVLGPLAP